MGILLDCTLPCWYMNCCRTGCTMFCWMYTTLLNIPFKNTKKGEQVFLWYSIPYCQCVTGRYTLKDVTSQIYAAHKNDPHLYMKAEPALTTEHYYKAPFRLHQGLCWHSCAYICSELSRERCAVCHCCLYLGGHLDYVAIQNLVHSSPSNSSNCINHPHSLHILLGRCNSNSFFPTSSTF